MPEIKDTNNKKRVSSRKKSSEPNNNNNNNNHKREIDNVIQDVDEFIINNKKYFEDESTNVILVLEKFCSNKKQMIIDESAKKLKEQCNQDIKNLYIIHNHEIPICPVCQEEMFDDKIKKLKECEHSLCDICFEKMTSFCCNTKISVKCPVCRKVSHQKILKRLYHPEEGEEDSDFSD